MKKPLNDIHRGHFMGDLQSKFFFRRNIFFLPSYFENNQHIFFSMLYSRKLYQHGIIPELHVYNIFFVWCDRIYKLNTILSLQLLQEEKPCGIKTPCPFLLSTTFNTDHLLNNFKRTSFRRLLHSNKLNVILIIASLKRYIKENVCT